MKEHAKKALKHDFEVAGKTIPTLAVAALLLVGTGSAALLSSFGTVSGTADVQQAVVLDSEADFSFAGTQTAGETVIETRTLESNANVTTEIGFSTSCAKGAGDATSIEGTSADFSGDCKGIDTEYVEYFDSAGHDHSSYSPSNQSVAEYVVGPSADYQSIGSAIAAASPDETIFVKDGTYGQVQDGTIDEERGLLVNKSLTLVSENGPSSTTIEGHTEAVYITADDVTIEGFTVTTKDSDQSSGDYGETGIRVEDKADGLVIKHNVIEDLKDEHTVSAIGIDMKDGNTGGTDVLTDGVTIKNNLIQNVATPKPWSGDDQAANVISLNERVDNAVIRDNTIKDIGGPETKKVYGVSFFEDGGPDPRRGPQNFELLYNDFSNLQATSDVVDLFVGGYEVLGDSHDVESNNFEVGLSRYLYSHVDPSSADSLNASENFFADGVETVGDVNASWKEKSDTSIEAGTTDKFGIVNEFAINLKPDSYDLETSITAPNGETPNP
jgi:hypothetical protein